MKEIIIICLAGMAFLFQEISPDIITVNHFDNHAVGEMPVDWKGRKKRASRYYKVAADPKDSTNRYLAAHTENSDMFIIRRVEVDIAKYPYLNWKWRARKFPPDGDESVKKKCDVVASVNVVLVAVRWRPKTIKYSWSTTLPQQTHTRSPYSIWPARADIVVVRSGTDQQGKWIAEKVNVLEDYKRLYGKEKVDSYVIDAIAIMSDSDNTKSESAADYDEIYFSKN